MTKTDLLKWLLSELDSTGLQVVKIPLHPGYIRCAVSQNAPWYQDFCSYYLQSRKRYPKLRTTIKRRETRNALIRMIAGNEQGIYAERINEWINRTYPDDTFMPALR